MMAGHLFTWPADAGHLAVVQELVARGADLFVTAANGKTAFDYGTADDMGSNNVVDYLLHAYTDKVSAREGLQAIHSILQAATFSYVAAHPPQDPPLDPSLQVQLPLGKLTLDHFQTLLQLFPANSFRSGDNDGALPLHIACRVGAPVEILRLLVQKYAAALQTADNNGEFAIARCLPSRCSIAGCNSLCGGTGSKCSAGSQQ